VLEREAAHNELAAAWRLNVLVHGMAGRYGLASEAAAQSTRYARLAGNVMLAELNGTSLAQNALFGSTPVVKAIAECEALMNEGLNDRISKCHIVCAQAQLLAMNGELDQARTLYRRSRALLSDLGQGVPAAAKVIDMMTIELHGGDLALAELEARADYAFLEGVGETYYLSTLAGLLARVVRDQGRDAEALALSQTAEQLSAADDVTSQVLWRSTRAPIVARGGDLSLAEQLARQGVDMIMQTEAPNFKADALAELACVLHLAGKIDEARRCIADAIDLYSIKGNIVAATRCRSWAAGSGAA